MVAYKRIMRSIILGHYGLHYSERDGRADPDRRVRVKPIHRLNLPSLWLEICAKPPPSTERLKRAERGSRKPYFQRAKGISLDILPALKREDSHGTAPLGWDIVVHDTACSCGRTLPVDLSNRRTDGCAKQPLLLSCVGFGVTVARIFSAAFRSLFATNPHVSQTYSPRSTRLESASVPHSQHVFDVFNRASSTRSTSILRSSALYSM
jgi:hypothetical protein